MTELTRWELLRQVRRYLTTIELESMEGNSAVIERCACEAIKLIGQIAGVENGTIISGADQSLSGETA